MFEEGPVRISPPLVQAIEDAILLGHLSELDGVLELIKEKEFFPEELRYGIEALYYFRMYYGKNGTCMPVDEEIRRYVIRMESSWGRELIESMGYYPDLTEAGYA